MKLQEAILKCPPTGNCTIDVDKVCRLFGQSTISRWHDKHRLVNRRAGIKLQITPRDARKIIDKLGLVEVKEALFTSASTYMTRSRLQARQDEGWIEEVTTTTYRSF